MRSKSFASATDPLVVGYVVMPDHVHLLIGEPAKGTPSIVLQALKQRVSRDLRKNSRDADLQRFWQARFYDFNVHSAKKKKGKARLHACEPVKRGLVKDPAEWAWSSWSFYATGRWAWCESIQSNDETLEMKSKSPTRKTGAWGTHLPHFAL